MIPENHKQEIISTGITFLRSITEAYGPDDGMKLWDAIASTLDPDVKGTIFFALLTGEEGNIITLRGVMSWAAPNKVSLIKAVRQVTGLGLKEAKDHVDIMVASAPYTPGQGYGPSVITNNTTKIDIGKRNRSQCMQELRTVGFVV